MLCGWEGNFRSGIALAMLCITRLRGLSTYGLNGQCAGDEHPAYIPVGVWPSFAFAMFNVIVVDDSL